MERKKNHWSASAGLKKGSRWSGPQVLLQRALRRRLTCKGAGASPLRTGKGRQ